VIRRGRVALALAVALGVVWPHTAKASPARDVSFKATPFATAKALPQLQTPAEDALAMAARADECEALCELAASVEEAPFGYVLGRRPPLGRIFLYDDTSLLAEYDTDGNEVAKYDYGGDRLIRLTRSDEGTRYFSFDGLGSVTGLTDTTGAVTAAYHLDAWGNYRFTSELAPSKNRFGFTGHYWDNEAGLYYAKARYYDPFTARFTQADSFLGNIDDPPSLHRYFYGNANPTRFVDPTGHSAEGDNFWGWFAFHLSGGLIEAPTQAFDRVQGLLTPGDESNSGRAATQQRKWLDVAGNKRVDPVTRTVATLEAMKLQGAVVLEETIVRPAANVPENARKVGIHAHEAMTATDRTAMAVGVLGATAAFAEATGGLVPLVPERSLGTKLIGSTEIRVLQTEQKAIESLAPSSGAASYGRANNIKGSVFENVSDSAARRVGEFPFFRASRRGGMDFGLIDDGTVVLREAKFANQLQFDDFTAITKNLQSNIAEIRAGLAKAQGLTRAQRAMIGQTLDEALAGRVPGNLKIQVQTGKATVGRRLQGRLRRSTGGIPVEFVELP